MEGAAIPVTGAAGYPPHQGSPSQPFAGRVSASGILEINMYWL